MKSLLLSDAVDAAWSARAAKVMEGLRAEHAFLSAEPTSFVEGVDETTWHTFAGGAANALLARLLDQALGPRCSARNTSITLREGAATSLIAIRACIAELRKSGGPTAQDASKFVDPEGNARISKFEPCLPQALLRELVAESLYDVTNARLIANS
jgi:ATP-dependent Lhr-like helicase